MASATLDTWVGKSLKRKEDGRLIRGEGQYLSDMVVPRMLCMGIIRSPHAHAMIKSIDISRALAMPGVVTLVTGQDFKNWKTIISDASIPNLPGETKRPLYHPLPVEKVYHVGEPVAAVVTRSKYQLEDAMDLVDIDYEPIPAVIDAEEAMKPGAPLLYPEWGDNLIYHQRITGGDINKAFADADLVVKERFECHRCGAQPMETRSCIAIYDAAQGLTLWATTQRPHNIRDLLADYLEIPHDKVRVIQPRDMGSGYGTKAPFYREDIVACALAIKLRQPVKWVENRMESLMNVGQERDQIHYVEAALRKDGKILGIRDKMIANDGDGQVGIYGGFAMPHLGAMYFINGNDIPAVDIDLNCVVTNKASLTPVRSFGSYAGRFAIDRIIDIAGHKLGIDPLEMRRRNAIKNFPHTTPIGIYVDSGDFMTGLSKAAAAIHYESFREEQAAARKQGRYLGVGFGMGIELSGVPSEVLVELENTPGYGVATVKIDAQGKVQVAEGDSPHGQSHETTFAQAVASELGLTPDDVYITYGDTFSTPFATGTLGSRGASYTISAAVLAARALRPKICQVAAHLLKLPKEEASDANFSFENGQVIWKKEPSKRVSLRDVAHTAILAPTRLPLGSDINLEQTYHFEAAAPGMHSCNVHAIKVEVFPETGTYKILKYVAVDDCGVPINPMIVRGQIHGGIWMGLGNATSEEYVYDENGQQLSLTLLDYHMLSAADMPSDIEVIDNSVPSPHTPLGSKGKGEGVPGMVPATLANAIEDALSPFAITINKLPLRPEYIWRLIHSSGKTSTQSADR
ncbi:MAG TPA: xanthine dehydrogenase family protein molybdopterin-binding subunit [Candidatus Binataceae bacterium]|nr:xanthine dehydrogenase family protein molybdopterin-binding subunit [Candidatus Binataceae bacterium]